MPKRQFQATEGLLHDVMRKQSGVIEKAWLEALMNSVDANASSVEFTVKENRTLITDDGDSMTQDEVERYFEQFGLKDDDIEDKEFGKFRMGRGQIFNFGVNIWRARQNFMVVSLDDEKVSVSLPECTDTDDESIISVDGDDYTLDTEGLSYALLDAEEYDEGLVIEVQHYRPIEDLDSTISEFKKLARFVGWLHNVEVVVNGDTLDEEPEVISETDNAWFVEEDSRHSNRSPVYNKGAYVDTFKLGPRRLGIITKQDLDVTLDRTDILDSDQYWQKIQKEYKAVIIEQMMDDDNLSKSERNWLLEEAANNATLIQMIQDKPLLEDVEGDMWTITEIASSKIGFADRDDTVAQDANSRAGVLMLRNHHESSLEKFVDSAQETIAESNLKTYQDIVDEKLAFEMEEVKVEKLSKRRIKNLRMLSSAMLDLGFTGQVKAGYSNHKRFWKDDEGTVFIHKEELNGSKNEIATEVFFELVKVAAHDGDTRSGMKEDFSLNRNFYNMANGDNFSADVNFPEAQRKLLSGSYE